MAGEGDKERRAQIGVIGAGWWVVQNHLPILARRSDVELVGVCRLGAAELERVRSEFGTPYATEDYRELLRECGPLDGVVVGSPHWMHYEHARAALAGGAHVMVEKPLTTSALDARALFEVARERGKKILIPHGWNFRRATREARRLIRKGRLGGSST